MAADRRLGPDKLGHRFQFSAGLHISNPNTSPKSDFTMQEAINAQPRLATVLIGAVVFVLAIPQGELSFATTQQELAKTWVERAVRVVGGEEKLRSPKTIRTSAHGYQNHVEDS
jgi:hypothetical protein